MLVIGGYDRARINSTSNFTRFPVGQWTLNRACPLQVSIRNLTFASLPLMKAGDADIQACIEPSMQRFTLPPAVALSFASYTLQNSTLFPKTMRYDVTARPAGDLQITLSNGYQSTISNQELFQPLRASDKTGRYTISNDSVVEAFISDTRDLKASDVAVTLGAMFLTFNYLMVDYAKGEFNLAPSITTKLNDLRPDLVTVCTPNQSGLANPSASASPPAPARSSTNKGAIAGGVVGGVAGLALIAALVFCIFRRRRRAPNDANASPPRPFPPRNMSEMSANEGPSTVYEMASPHTNTYKVGF